LIKNILITGANGQDGKIILQKLYKRKINLILIDKRFKKKIRKKNIKYFEINLKDKKKLEKLFKFYKVDVVLNLASNNPNYRQNSYYKHYLENINNFKNLIDNLTKYKNEVRFISCSSSRIFRKKTGLVNENSNISANDFYSKFRIETNDYLIKTIKKNKNFDFTNVILFNHDSLFRSNRFLLPRIILALISKNQKFLNQIIKENIVMDYSHAEDICDALIKILFFKKKIKNIILSSGKKTFINDIIKYLIKKNKLDLKLNYNNIKKKYCIIGNNTYAKKTLGWKIKKNIFLAAQEIFKKNIFSSFVKKKL
jgi:nucleoside-diphosphate-sugar epimerase